MSEPSGPGGSTMGAAPCQWCGEMIPVGLDCAEDAGVLVLTPNYTDLVAHEWTHGVLDRLDGKQVGDFVFVDHDGLNRYAGRTCNVFGSQQDAATAARSFLDAGSMFWVFRTRTGQYLWSAIEDPRGVPELEDAVLVQFGVVES